MENIENKLEFAEKIETLKNEIRKNIIGQENLIENIVIALLTDGHILLEWAPWLAKTFTISTFSKALNLDFSRIQFTPDLLPSDLIWVEVYNQAKHEFSVKKWPIFANFILADEINRAPSKVQSALLESMQEKQVTIGDNTFKLDKPFLVLATQNPIEQEGTYNLPEAQLDRFLFKTVVDYPTEEEELEIMKRYSLSEEEKVQNIFGKEDLDELKSEVEKVFVDDNIYGYVNRLVFATRKPEEYNLGEIWKYIEYPASPRASISFIKSIKAKALISGRDFVIPEDVKAVAMDVLRHRVGVSFEAIADGISSDDVVKKILNTVNVI